MDFKIKCNGCGREVMIPRLKCEKNIRKIPPALRRGVACRGTPGDCPEGCPKGREKRKGGTELFENLQVFENRYEELNNKLYDPQTAADRALYAALMKEHKELSPIVEAYRAYLRCERDLQGARELLEEGGDRELREMAQQEIREKGAQLSRIEEELKLLLLPRDPNDEKNVIVEIRGGAGGEEAALFRLQPVPDVHLLRGEKGLENRASQPQRDRAGGLLKRSPSSSTGRGPTPG